MPVGLTIGKLAMETGINPKTIRYYEEIGLLPRAQRNGSGYRTYTAADLERLMLIRRARLLGLSLAETKELVGYAVDGHCPVLESRLASMLEERLAEIDSKIADLNRLKAEMSDYRSRLRKRPCSKRSQTAPHGPAALLGPASATPSHVHGRITALFQAPVFGTTSPPARRSDSRRRLATHLPNARKIPPLL